VEADSQLAWKLDHLDRRQTQQQQQQHSPRSQQRKLKIMQGKRTVRERVSASTTQQCEARGIIKFWLHYEFKRRGGENAAYVVT